jgi:hypothetical protein
MKTKNSLQNNITFIFLFILAVLDSYIHRSNEFL